MMMATAVLGLIAGVGGTTLGGLLVVWLGRVADRYLSPLLAFAAGVMLSLVVFDMMPSALSASGPVHTCIGAGIGFVAIYVSEKVVRVLERRMLGSQDTLVSIGLTVGAAIGLHNFAEGLAIGAGLVIMVELGITVAVLITIHNIPEGMAMAVPFKLRGMRSVTILLLTTLAGLPMGAGALIGYFGSVSRAFLGFSLAFSLGAMVYVSVIDLIPSSVRLSSRSEALIGLLGGVLLGFLAVWAI
ncbi:MAG: ZIP family metal transporter [Bacillota bacterium]|jgi:ZIP family zinc transporter|nr:ZIP family metal transporter [Bacillota bacterium]HPZ53815.1 ZIP family metal transporter [Bacillota bacterium]HQD17324.1 ZIP family metal transporter [Bacillota bacterium]